MRSSNLVAILISLVVLAYFVSISGCVTVLPKSFATPKEAYPSSKSFIPPSNAPRDSFKRAVFEAPYDDVFRAVKVSVSQVMLNIESSNKAKGEILATSIKNTFNPKTGDPREIRYYYGILVKEIGPETTEVTILAKRQRSCKSLSRATACLSFGATLPHIEECNEETVAVKLATDAVEQLSQFMTVTRNNLIASGVI